MAAPAEPPGADGAAAVPRRARAGGRRTTRGRSSSSPSAARALDRRAGQFTMLYAFGVGEVPISVSGQAGGALVHTVRAVGAGDRGDLRRRARRVLGVRGPFGNAWPIEAAAGGDVVVVAGGIGLAPLRPVVYRALAGRRATTARSRCSTAAARPPTCSTPTSSSAGGARLQRRRHGRRGRRGLAAARSASSPKLIARRAVRPGLGRRVRLRAGDHDALRAPRRCSSAASRRSGSTSRWSATCSAGSATAATASSARR